MTKSLNHTKNDFSIISDILAYYVSELMGSRTLGTHAKRATELE